MQDRMANRTGPPSKTNLNWPTLRCLGCRNQDTLICTWARENGWGPGILHVLCELYGLRSGRAVKVQCRDVVMGQQAQEPQIYILYSKPTLSVRINPFNSFRSEYSPQFPLNNCYLYRIHQTCYSRKDAKNNLRLHLLRTGLVRLSVVSLDCSLII